MSDQGTAWISEGLEVLLAELGPAPNPDRDPDFDVLIIGSGYGGSIAASRLAGATDTDGKRLKVGLLERGKEYLPGMFPAGFSSLAGHVRLSAAWKSEVLGNRDGLFDIRISEDINTLIANGLGGGSLINAGVMEVPRPATFDHRWPLSLRGGESLLPYYAAVKKELGSFRNGADNTISQHPDTQQQALLKHLALKKLSRNDKQGRFRDAAITVAMDDVLNHAGVSMNKCTLCGDCATGCNFGAKESLDLNLLVTARRNNVRIFTGATVLGLCRQGDAWAVDTCHTLPQLTSREGGAVKIIARRVILAAGALGSTEILLRSQRSGLALSTQVGKRFSGNGDMIAVGYDMNEPVNAVANESQAYADRHIGPTITGVIDRRYEGNEHPVVIEEMAVPGAMRRLFEEIYTSTDCLRSLANMDWSPHRSGNPSPDPLSVNETSIRHSQVYAVIGDDGAGGELYLREPRKDKAREPFFESSDGALGITWPGLRYNPLFPAQIEQLETLTKSSGSGGHVIPNPLWQTFPDSMNFLLDRQNGPLLTVHPLGGCAMADSSKDGAVNPVGQVYTGQDEAVYESLAVIDGAMIPSAVGTNPALTIAAVSARAMDELLQRWSFSKAQPTAPIKFLARPAFAEPPTPEPVEPTTMQFAERLRGPVELNLDGSVQQYMAEITLFFRDKPLQDLTASEDTSGDKHSLKVAEHSDRSRKLSQLRLFRLSEWKAIEAEHLSGRLLEQRLEKSSILTAPLSGSLKIMARQPSGWLGRMSRSSWAWLLNRGMRDIWQACFPLSHERLARRQARQNRRPEVRGLKRWLRCGKICMGLKYSSRAGEIRLFEYQLVLGQTTHSDPGLAECVGKRIIGSKHIGYRRRGNPLRQLMEITLSDFPGLVRNKDKAARLKLAPEFLARQGLPLFRIIKQQDTPQALADIISLCCYFLRLLASTHLMSMRAPDLPVEREPGRLPPEKMGEKPEELKFSKDEYEIKLLPDGEVDPRPLKFRLSRYESAVPRKSHYPPVIMIHGYSASGTSFAHQEVKPNLVTELGKSGRDLWVLDMRSSCGMDEPTRNFSFEELAQSDIPLAIDKVCELTGADKVDIVAHCMGAAMLSMAVLSADRVPDNAPYREQHRALPGRINRLVMSQVGPLVSMAPANIFRAYALSYLKKFLPLEDYQFTPGPGPLDAALDRLLSLLPYSNAEYDLENPLLPWRRTPFTRTRHRLDLLYGRTFSLQNLAPKTLAHIDDLFGPLSVDTATQVVHFARYQTITDHSGNNSFVSREQLEKNWRFPTLSLHGRCNGLADVATVGRLQRILKDDAHRNWEYQVFDNLGHQDSLIGSNAGPVFASIREFLDRPGAGGVSPPEQELLLQPPWSGPVLGPLQEVGEQHYLPVSFGINPALSAPRLMLSIPLGAGPDGFELLHTATGGMLFSAHSLLPQNSGNFEHNWGKLMLPLDANETLPDSLLLLLVYDECVDLDNASFGKGASHINAINAAAEATLEIEHLDEGCSRCIESNLGPRQEELLSALRLQLQAGPDTLLPGIVRLPRYRRPDALRFALGSCQFAPGILDEKPGFAAYQRLAEQLEDADACRQPELLLLTGDQVYVDATAGLFDPGALDEYFLYPYQRWYRSTAVRRVMRKVPAYMMLDDHEIADNWEPIANNDDGKNEETAARGTYFFQLFQRGPQQSTGPRLWYELEENGFNFFVADTRSARTHRTSSSVGSADMLGPAQSQALENWLRRVAAADPGRPKFILCPAMPFPRQRRAQQHNNSASAIHSDSWDGYPATMQRLLELIVELEIQNLVMLNGDAHLSCVAEVCLPGNSGELRFWSVHSSGLYSPLPFANARQEELVSEEQFSLDDGKLQGRVKTDYAPAGDGFAVLEVERDEGGEWQLSVSFDREAKASDPAWQQQILPRSDCAHPEP